MIGWQSKSASRGTGQAAVGIAGKQHSCLPVRPCCVLRNSSEASIPPRSSQTCLQRLRREGLCSLGLLSSQSRLGLHRPCRGTSTIVCGGGPSGGMKKIKRVRSGELDTVGKKLLVATALLYVGVVIFVPFINVFFQAFRSGFGPFMEHLVDEDFLHAAKLTMLLALIAVPVNTVFGIVAALQLTRNEFPGKTFVMSLLDLPFSISPVVTGLMLVLLYGREGLFAPIIRATGFNIVFAFPGMALATLFVTLPFVVRELIPVLEAMDMSEEEAARTLGASDWQVFWNVTLPNIRWGLLYGVILTNARAMGEFGAVSVISGNIIGKTQTLTLYVESAYKEYNNEAAFSASVLLSFLALGTLFIKEFLERKNAE